MRPNGVVLALALAACSPRGADAPPAVAYGEVACDYCHMTIEREAHAAQLVPVSGRPRVFDEPGCLLRHVAQTGAVAGDRLWVHDEATGAWIDARAAVYVVPERPPSDMMYGVLAYGSPAAAAAAHRGARAVPFDDMLRVLRS